MYRKTSLNLYGTDLTIPRCVFFVEDMILSSNAVGGGPALAFGHFELLSSTKISIVLFVLANKVDSEDLEIIKSDSWAKIESRIASCHIIQSSAQKSKESVLSRFLKAMSDPAAYRLGNQLSKENLVQFRQLAKEVGADFIWAEDLVPATIAQRATPEIPIIYSHYDWKWKIKQHRDGIKSNHWKKRFHYWLSRRHEENLVRQVAGCVSASFSETDEIRNLGPRNPGYFPVFYSSDPPILERDPERKPRIVHLGGMQTTANRIGLQRFLEVAWPRIVKNLTPEPELWVIGSLADAPNDLLEELEKCGAVCTGFVEDLSSVLRFGDIHIIPWEYNTGTRTRIPLVLSFGQVLVSTKAAAACVQELQDNENAILADDLIQMAQKIVEVFQDDELRARIAKSGWITFENSFTREAIQPRFDEYLAMTVIGGMNTT